MRIIAIYIAIKKNFIDYKANNNIIFILFNLLLKINKNKG